MEKRQCIEMIINDEMLDGVFAISLVDKPAIEENFIKVKSIEKETDDKIWNAIALPVDEALNIGTNWDLSATLASVKDGILHISLPKIEEKKPKKVSIKVG